MHAKKSIKYIHIFLHSCFFSKKASVIIWDFEARSFLHKYEVHRSTIFGLAFSCDSKFLYSIGGLEDHCLVVWSKEQELVIGCTS